MAQRTKLLDASEPHTENMSHENVPAPRSGTIVIQEIARLAAELGWAVGVPSSTLLKQGDVEFIIIGQHAALEHCLEILEAAVIEDKNSSHG